MRPKALLLGATFVLLAGSGIAAARPTPSGAGPEGWSSEVTVLRSHSNADDIASLRFGGVGEAGMRHYLTADDLPADLRSRALLVDSFVFISIDASGRATGCEVVRASEEPRLDNIACELLPRRGRFRPTYLAPGRPAPTRWLMAIRWETMDAATRAERDRADSQRARIAPPPPLPGSDTWPRLHWSGHLELATLPVVEPHYPAEAQGAQGTVSLELGISPSAGITDCRVGVSAGAAALDAAACAVARNIDVRYADPCGVCWDDPLPLQVVWRRGASHIRFPLPSGARASRGAATLRDPADTRTASSYNLFPRPLEFGLAPRDFARIANRTVSRSRVTARVTVDARGRISACTLQPDSGNPEVDARVCELLIAGQRFDPAADVFGDPAPAPAMRWLDLRGLGFSEVAAEPASTN